MRPNNLANRAKIVIAIATLHFVSNAHAANWYVRPSPAGSNTGVDWNNAWSLSSIAWAEVHGGDTIWLAGGTYSNSPNLTTGASGVPGNPIKIYRVLSTDSAPVSAA